MAVPTKTSQELANSITLSSRESIQRSMSRLAGGNMKTTQDAVNTWAGTTGLTTQQALNSKAGTTGLSKQDALNALYQSYQGTLFEDFETIGDWTITGSAGYAGSIDSTIFKTGTGSLKLTATGVSSNCYATKTVNWDLSGSDPISFSVYIPDESSNTQTITVYLSNDSTFTNYFNRAASTSGNFTKGWNTITWAKSGFTPHASSSWASPIIRVRVRVDSTSSGGQIAYFDSIYAGKKTRPKLVITFDDGWESQLTEAYSYMATKGLKGTCYIPFDNIGTANYMTEANLATLYNAGWDIGNHTYNHTNLTTLGTQAEMEEEISLNTAYLNSLGFTRSSLHFAYPNGAYNDTVLLAVAAQNIKTARTVIGTAAFMTVQPPDDFYHLRIQNLGNTDALANIEAKIDRCIEEGDVLFLNGHKLVVTPTVTTEFGISDFQALMDYIKTKVDAGLIDVVTISEWYQGIIENQ